MTNHVHLLVTPQAEHAVSLAIQAVGRQYVRYFNNRHGRTGTLWEGRFKSCLVQEELYLLTCQRYIELNPVRAGMVKDPADHEWSSYGVHVLGRRATMWRPHPVYLALGRSAESRTAAYRQLFTGTMKKPVVDDIRYALNTGLALGSGEFKRRVEQLTGRRQLHASPGRRQEPRKTEAEKFLI